MAKLTKEALLDLDPRSAISACEIALAKQGWRLVQQSEYVLAAEKPPPLPQGTSIDAQIAFQPEGQQTRMSLTATTPGLGFLDLGFFKKPVTNLHDAIVESARTFTHPAKRQPAGRVFLSYRRHDCPDLAGRIYDHLVKLLGVDRVFRDIDSIPAASNFAQVIRDELQVSTGVVALMGPDWVGTTTGKRRIDDADDFVRCEIATALELKKPLLPVLIGGFAMPKEDELPESVSRICGINAPRVRSDPDFRKDMEVVIETLQGMIGVQSPVPSSPLPRKINVREVSHKTATQCTACFGRRTVTCPGCRGLGHTTRLSSLNTGGMDISPCLVCGGKKEVKCETCGGSGSMPA